MEKKLSIVCLIVCLLYSFWSCSLDKIEVNATKEITNNIESQIKSIDNRQPIAGIQIDSEYLYSATTGPIEVSGPHNSDGWTNWSSPLITSEWDGAPWSCIKVRLYKNTEIYSNPDLTFQFDSDWTNYANTTEKVTEWAYPGLDYTSWSEYAITSEWDGAPWSGLKVRVKADGSSYGYRYRLRIKSLYTDSGTTTPVTSYCYDDGTSNWSDPLIVGEWNGAPWPCISVKLEYTSE